MYKKTIIALSSLILLAACDTSETDETSQNKPDIEEPIEEPAETDNSEVDTPADENQSEESDDTDTDTNDDDTADTTSQTHVYDNLIDETTFMSEYGLQSWSDYKALLDGFTLGEVTIMNEENPDYTAIEGATRSELEERFEMIGVRDDVFQAENELSDMEEMVFHRYPPAEDGDYTETADFLSEISLYYVEDTLMYSAITPGLYSVELDNLPDAETFMSLLTVSEIEEIDPKIFTVAQMTINGNNIKQLMTPAIGIDQEGNEQVMAFYFFTSGEDILQYAYLPFEMVSQDFPTNSVILFQQVMGELENM